MTWVKLALILLQVANTVVNLIRSKQQMDAGADKAIAEASAAILMKTQSAKAVMEEVSGMSGDSLDVLLRKLEPGSDGQLLLELPEGDTRKG